MQSLSGMPRLAVGLLTALTILLVDRAPATSAPCVAVRAEARWSAYAYDHVVHLQNACAGAHQCDVATNVNPAPQKVLVPGRSAVEVLTFRGSPARTFVPLVTCTPVGGGGGGGR